MRYLLLLTVFIVISCETPTPPESKAEKLAKSLCGCTAKLLELNQLAQTTADSLSFRKIAEEFEKARECANNLEIKPEDRAALRLTLTTKCPVLAQNEDLLTELIGQ